MQQLTQGTNYVPSFRTGTDVNTLQERYFRELKKDCAINSASDAYYVSAIACFCLTFIFPPGSDRCCPLRLSSKEVSERRSKMMFFIHHVQTYKNVNRKGQEMCEFAQAYDRILVQNECAMDSLKCEFEEVVKELNDKYPHQKVLKFNGHNGDSSGGQWSIKLGDDDSSPVCHISYSKVRGHYSFGEGSHLLEQKGDQP